MRDKRRSFAVLFGRNHFTSPSPQPAIRFLIAPVALFLLSALAIVCAHAPAEVLGVASLAVAPVASRESVIAGIAEELKAIRESLKSGKGVNQLIDEGAAANLLAAQEQLDILIGQDEAKMKESPLVKAIDALVEKQLEERWKARAGRYDLLRTDRILGAIDHTGLTLQQKMFMQGHELERYLGKHQVDDIRAMQNLWDESLIAGLVLCYSKNKGGDRITLHDQIKQTRAYKQYAEFARAMDTATANEGKELIPTDFSAQILEVVATSLKLAATFGTITMPTSPFKLPVATSDDVGFKAPENLTDNFLTEANKISGITPTTTNVTFTAQKPGALAVFSEEINEDAVIAVVPFLRGKLAMSLANAIERAIIDGDTAGTHQDSDVTAATDARKLWNGIRKDVDPATNGVDIATFNLTNLRSLRKQVDPEFAEDPEQLVYAVSVGTELKLLEFPEFITVDKFGPNATILRGQVGRIDNSPVLTSKYVREDLNATGVHDGTTTTKTYVALYNRNAYMIGNRRGVTLKFAESIWSDQGVLVATQRADFQKVRSGKTVAAIGHNITA